MSNGFVYILLNPAFPRQVKIGRTGRDSQTRAKELSRRTGVPDDYLVLFDVLVTAPKIVEQLMHERFASSRVYRNKEFFHIPPKEAIVALQELAADFLVQTDSAALTSDLLPHFNRYFGKWMDPSVVAIRLVHLPSVCFLEVTRQPESGQAAISTRDAIPLEGILEPENPTPDHLRSNDALLRQCNEYDWIMISTVFSPTTARAIAAEWEGPEGRLNAAAIEDE